MKYFKMSGDHCFPILIFIIICFKPANTTLKDYGRFQKDGELKVLSHQESRMRNR